MDQVPPDGRRDKRPARRPSLAWRIAGVLLACALALAAGLYVTNRLPWQRIAESATRIDTGDQGPGRDASLAAPMRLLQEGALDPHGYMQLRRRAEGIYRDAPDPRLDARH